MSTPENEPENPQIPPAKPAQPQYGQVAPQDPNAPVPPPYGQTPQYGAPQQNPYGQNPAPYGQNPYGQNPTPYGQNPNGQNPNPYGQPPQASTPYGQQPYGAGFPVPPQGNFPAPKMPTERPKELDIAFWAIIAAGIANLASFIILAVMISEDMIRDSFNLVMQSMPELAQQLDLNSLDLSAMVQQSRISYVVTGVVALGIYILIAFMIRKGSNVARIFATIFAALSLLALGGGTILGILSLVLGIVGVVFAWLRPASAYIAARRAARAAGYR